MRRLVLQVSDSQTFGGAEQVVLQLLERLDGRWDRALLHAKTRYPEALIHGVESLGIEHFGAEFPMGVRGLPRLSSLVRQLVRIRPSVVHVHLTTPLACRFTFLAASLARVPAIIATAHLVLPSTLESIGVGQRMRTRVVHPTVDRYIAVCESIRSKLRDELSVPDSKIEVVQNGVATEQFNGHPGKSKRAGMAGGSRQRVALVAARLVEQKGHRFLIDAATRLPDMAFLLAGDGPERGALERQAEALGVAGRVRFLGHRQDVPALLAACDLFVLPSLFEGLPIAILEAMAAGKPVVATAVGGTDEAVIHGETGLLVPPTDAAALAGAIDRLATDDALAHRFGGCGRARVESHFRVDRMVQRVAAIYEQHAA